MKTTSMVVMLFLSLALSIPSQAALSPPVNKKETPPLVSHKIDLNKANVEELSGHVKGIGKKRAEAIIKYREAHQGFKSIEELSQVPGLGKLFVKSHITQLQEKFTVE